MIKFFATAYSFFNTAMRFFIEIKQRCDIIINLLTAPEPKGRASIIFLINKIQIGGTIMDLKIRVSDGPQNFHINFTSDSGNPEKVSADSIVCSNTAVGTVALDPTDNTKGIFTPVGVGEADLNGSAADAAGDAPFTFACHVIVLDEEATKGEIVWDGSAAKAAS